MAEGDQPVPQVDPNVLPGLHPNGQQQLGAGQQPGGLQQQPLGDQQQLGIAQPPGGPPGGPPQGPPAASLGAAPGGPSDAEVPRQPGANGQLPPLAQQ